GVLERSQDSTCGGGINDLAKAEKGLVVQTGRQILTTIVNIAWYVTQYFFWGGGSEHIVVVHFPRSYEEIIWKDIFLVETTGQGWLVVSNKHNKGVRMVGKKSLGKISRITQALSQFLLIVLLAMVAITWVIGPMCINGCDELKVWPVTVLLLLAGGLEKNSIIGPDRAVVIHVFQGDKPSEPKFGLNNVPVPE